MWSSVTSPTMPACWPRWRALRPSYFSYPVGAGLTEAAGLFAAAGRERDLQLVVDLSLDAAFPESPSPQGRVEWVAERIFEWAGYGGAHLRVAAFFMENLLSLYGRQVREHGQIRNSFGDFEPSWIAGSDVGAMGAALLAEPGLITERTTVVGGGQRASQPPLPRSSARPPDTPCATKPSHRRNGATS